MGPAKEGAAGAVPQRTLFGHPIGLYILFFTELWERFSYYGMRGLLALYMVKGFRWNQEEASTVYKLYTTLVYLTPLLGGFLADRYLGNKKTVIIGAILMAIGHFLMAFESQVIFYAALVFLIFGNGFFKPNMSTQVGRLYGVNDPRRDGAYTIFYMGINLGAFFSPLVCGWLAENTEGGYHSGFAIAGVGMVIGLVIYVVGMPWVVEMPQGRAAEFQSDEAPERAPGAASPSEAVRAVETGVHAPRALPEGAEDPSLSSGVEISRDRPAASSAVLTESAAERALSTVPFLNKVSPTVFLYLGLGLALGSPVLPFVTSTAWNSVLGLEIAASWALISALVTANVRGALRDRVLAINLLGLFVIAFWAAFEQAGNAMNLWADMNTNRYLTGTDEPPPLFPKQHAAAEAAPGSPAEESGAASVFSMFKLKPRPAAAGKDDWLSSFNPTPTAWFQSINPLAIFLLAPPFAILWVYLDRRKLNPSIPVKMAIGIGLQALAFALMIGAAAAENQPTSTTLTGGALPAAIEVKDGQQLYAREIKEKKDQLAWGESKRLQAGRLTWDAANQTLQLRGVLSDVDRDAILFSTTPDDYLAKLNELWKASVAAEKPFTVAVKLDPPPPGLDLQYAGFSEKAVSYDKETQELKATIPLAAKDIKGLMVAGSNPQFREALNTLMVESTKYRVSLWWLVGFYLLSTLGELCLSPVGLSMVSKLAPAKYATMLMGLWLVVTALGNFLAGAMGERYGSVPPTDYFLTLLVALGVAALLLYFLGRKIGGMMHGVT